MCRNEELMARSRNAEIRCSSQAEPEVQRPEGPDSNLSFLVLLAGC